MAAAGSAGIVPARVILLRAGTMLALPGRSSVGGAALRHEAVNG
jgi:hypothetical protein